ncbi:GIP, partial [Symbiodinium necroappetens]
PCPLGVTVMSTTVKSDLADRYARLTDPTAGLSMEQLQAMSVQELGDFQVDFGRAMKSRKYIDVVENESDWVKWMLSHMTGSEKRCHRIFFLFLEKYTAEAETIEGALRGGDPPSDRDLDEPTARNTKVRPKSKAAPRNAVAASSSSGLDQWDVIAETSDAAPPLDNQVTAMATRLTQLEHVMEQVLVALQQITPPPVWQPVFDLAARCAQQANALIAPQSHLAKGIQEALDLHGIEVLQAFVGKKIRNLQSPLGNEDRSNMSAERKKLRVGVHEILITVFGRKRGPPAAAERASPPDDVPGGSGESQPSRPDLEGWAPPPTPIHGPAFRNLDKAAKSQLVRIHNNLGHPSPETPAKHLKAAGEDPVLVQAALDYQCDACLESTEPRHQRPSKLPEVLEFNDLLGVDGFFFKGRSGYRSYVLHALDEASCFHLGRRALSRGTKHATTTLAELWFSWAGNPRKVYLDPAGEFRSEEILDHFQSLNIRTFVTAAAWQRGRLERHGDIVKDMLTRLDTQSPLVNDELFDQALLQAFQAKNALVRHRGYAPEQIVLGKSLRVPGSNSSDEDLGAHSVLEGTDLEAELQRQRLDVRCRARQVFWEADNNQTIRRALLRRSNPVRGPYKPGDWVLYWMRKGSPNRLAAGRWHGPARVISQEGQSITWISHGTIILRCAPENLRPASLREWQQLSASDQGEITRNAGGASSFTAPPRSLATGEIPVPVSITVPPNGPPVPPADEDIAQPEQELTPQVSHNPEDPAVVREVERAAGPLPSSAAPSLIPNSNLDATSAPPEPTVPGDPAMLESVNIPVPDSDDGLIVEAGSPFVPEEALCGETVLMASSDRDCGLSTFLTLQPGAFCLEIPLKAKVNVKDLTPHELQLFEKAKEKEIQCWIQTSAIKAVLRRRLNPEQILRSRWILTWKSPEPGEDQRRAKARLVVLGFQDPKLVDVMRDAPTLSKEGRALVLQTISSMKYELSSFDIKTAFLRGKADENNPLAMEPPRELRQALGLQEDEVCQLLGNAYGRVDAPLLFYKELSQQLYQLGFIRHPLEPCVFLLYTGTVLNGILGVHVDDGVCGGDAKFSQKIQALQSKSKLPFGSRKHRNFVFTGIHLEQFPDYSIRASQGEYVRNIQQIDIGRARRMLPEAAVTEDERSKLRGLIGSMQYAVTHTRPDMAAKLGEIQGQVTKATVQTLLSANKVLRETQEQAEVCIYFLPISPQELTFVSFGDASFASSKNLNSHQGAIVCEHRTTLEVLLIKQRCAENATFRWIPTTLQAADCLTKAMDSTLLRTVLSQGRFKLYDTSKTLEKDAQRRQAIAWLSQPSQLSP